MKRISVIVLICSSILVPLRAQEKYNVVLEQTKGLSPYEAIYVLMDYQAWHPDNASIYYHLGDLCYDLLPTRDPLHHYTELSSLLYQSRLFYGNCLHFAKDQKLPGWQYEPLAQGQKKIEYDALKQYIKPRLEEVKRQQTACDSIHHTFVRMTERYNRCQNLFTDFLNRYSREKTAHLQLLPAERRLLEMLRQATDSLNNDIEAYQQALALQPVPAYAPVFHKEPIVLYRLDGLTHTDFLQNDIAIWDYSQWASAFLEEQEQVYERLYTDAAQEQRQLETQLARYRAGQSISGYMDETLLGRCDRLEWQTNQTDSIRFLQEAIKNGAAQQTIAQSNAPQSIRELIPLLQLAATRRHATQDSAWRTMNEQLIEMAQPLRIQQQPTYKHPITGETIAYQASEGEKVHCLLPDEMGYRCVLTDKAGDLGVLSLDYDRHVQKVQLRIPEEQALVFTKIPGGLWVLITDKKVYWVE